MANKYKLMWLIGTALWLVVVVLIEHTILGPIQAVLLGISYYLMNFSQRIKQDALVSGDEQ